MNPSCLRCGNCCTRFGVCITPFDIRRIKEATGKEPEEFVDTVPEPETRERTEPAIIINSERSLLVLKRKRGNVCFFYNGNGCAIYESRPLLCKSYPFRISDSCHKLKETKSRACASCWQPGGREKAQYLEDCRKYESELRAYGKIAEEWNTRGGGSLESFLTFALPKTP